MLHILERGSDRKVRRCWVHFLRRGAVGAALLVFLWADRGGAQPPRQQATPASSSAQPSSKDTQQGNPLPAKKDVDIGNFYLHKGDVDAAIGRYKDALRLNAYYAKARLLLAEAYEKKGDRTNALQCYQEYLKMFPDGREVSRVRKKVQKLSRSKS